MTNSTPPTELHHYLATLMRHLPVLLVVSFAVAAIVFGYLASRPVTHEVQFSYLVSLAEREPKDDFRFDGFYALQATDLFAATLAKLTQTPEVISAAFEAGGVAEIPKDPRDLAKAVSAEKTAPQLVQVVVRHEDAASVEKLASGLQAVVDESIDAYHDQAIPEVSFTVTATDRWEGESAAAAPIISLATFIAVLFFGANIVLLLEASRKQA